MLATSGLREIKKGRRLSPGEKRFILIIKPSGAEYQYNGTWSGRDVRNAMKLLIRSYKIRKRKMAKTSVLGLRERELAAQEEKEKNDGSEG